MGPHLAPAAEPEREPIVLTIGGENVVVMPDDPAWPIAMHARETETALRLCEAELRGKRSLVTKLRDDQEAEAEKARLSNPQREAIFAIFDVWRKASGRTRCKLTPERFDMVAARLAEDYEVAALVMAAVGVAVNPYVIEGEKRNDFETAFKSGSQVERYANRCPPERRREIMADGRLFT